MWKWKSGGGRFDLVRRSVEPIGTLTSFPSDGDQDGLDQRKIELLECSPWTLETEGKDIHRIEAQKDGEFHRCILGMKSIFQPILFIRKPFTQVPRGKMKPQADLCPIA